MLQTEGQHRTEMSNNLLQCKTEEVMSWADGADIVSQLFLE